MRNVSKKSHYELSESESDRIKEYLSLHNLKFENLLFPMSQAPRIREIIKKLQESDGKGSANLEHIIALAELTGIEKYKAEEMVNKLRLEGELIEKSIGRFEIVI